MAESKPKSRRRASTATTHQVPYPDRLHAHLDRAADAAASLASPADEAGQAPDPAALVDQYGGNDGLNTSKSEGG